MHIHAVRVRLGIMHRRRGLILAEVVLVSVGLLGQLRQQVARPLRHAVCHRVWNARMKMVANGPGQVSAVSSDEVRIMRKKKLKKLAEEFLWANLGDSMGGYGGGEKVFKKMPWNRLKSNEIEQCK